MENELVRYSRAGDVFHYRWAARRCLRMIRPKSPLKCVVIEGSKEREAAGEYVIDVAEYTEKADKTGEKISYIQLKHSTKRVESPFPLSELKDTVEGFAKRFIEISQRNTSTGSPRSAKFSIVTNRPISVEFKNGIQAIINGKKPTKRFHTTFKKYTKLSGGQLQDFCTSLELIDSEGDYSTQKYELHREISFLLAGIADNAMVDSVVALVQDQALPDKTGEIIREDILKRFGVTSERDLFPAPPEFEELKYVIQREQHKLLLEYVTGTPEPIAIHAEGGVGKTVVARQLAGSLPEGSLGIVYDCFGSGKYRNPSHRRHRHRDALVQIINEIATQGLCEPLIPLQADLDDTILRGFLGRLESAATALQENNNAALLVVFIDAADNAEMAAEEFNQPCFANELLRIQVPDGCRIVMLCRTERIDLLSPPRVIRQVELTPFSQTETLIHLKKYFPLATHDDGVEFLRLTAGNPRVQANSLSMHYKTVSEMLASLGPTGTTVDEQIENQLASAVTELKDQFTSTYQKQIDSICLGLANLSPFIPIKVLAAAAEVDTATVKSFVADLGRPLWISEDSIQFRDEPTETWFRDNFSASEQQVETFVSQLKPLATEFPYVAEVLPSLLLKAGKFEELISLALSDKLLPDNSPIDQRNIRVYRLQFAFKAALKQKRYADAAKLAFRAGEEGAGDSRQIELLKGNVDLIAPLQSQERVQELAFRRLLRSDWNGSENVYSAALLSTVEDFKGEARGYLRAAEKWLRLYFEERDTSKKAIHHERLQDEDIVELATAYFHLFGSEKLVAYILSWRPPDLIFKVIRLLTRRLVDAGNYEAVNVIAQIGARNQYLMIAIADELISVGRFPPENAMEQCLDLLCHKQSRIPKSAPDWNKDLVSAAIISFVEASTAVGLSKKKVLRIKRHYVSQRASHLVSSDHQDNARNIFLRAVALGSVLSGDLDPDIEAIMPEKLLEKETKYQQQEDIKKFKQVVGGLLPWYIVRARLLAGKKNVLSKIIQKADRSSSEALSGRWRDYDRIPFEISRIHLEILSFSKEEGVSEIDSFVQRILKTADKIILTDRLKAVRTAYRLEHLSGVRNQFEQTCYEIVESTSDADPETKAGWFIDLARSVLPVSQADAAAYFDCAIDAVAKFGDEIVERWEAVVAVAKQSVQEKTLAPEIPYRFIRCAEVVGDNIAREKYFARNEAIRVCTRLCPASSFAALSRWRDRGVGWFDRQLPALASEAVASQAVPPATGWALSAFFDDRNIGEFTTLCLEEENDISRQQYILDTAVRDMRLRDTSESDWQKLDTVAQRYSLKNSELKTVLDFYANQTKSARGASEKPRCQRTDEEESTHIDWEELLGSCDLTTSMGISNAIERFRSAPTPRDSDIFWHEVFKRIPENSVSKFLGSVVHAEKLCRYDIQNAFENLPESWSIKVSVKRIWNNLLSSIAHRFAHEFALYGMHYFLKKIRSNDMTLPVMRKGIIEGLSSSCDLADARSLFGFVSIVSPLIAPLEATDLLDFAITRFEDHIDEDYADGPWADWLFPSNTIFDAFTGFIWSGLGSPRSSVRWQAVHCVRRLAEAGCQQEINALMKWMNRDNVGGFGSNRFPFYNLHARLYLLIALARIAIDQPGILKVHYETFLQHALGDFSHILIGKFAAEIALSVETAFPGIYEKGVVKQLKNVGHSLFPPKEIRSDEIMGLSEHLKMEVDEDLQLHFAHDFDRYWFNYLGDVFGVSVKDIEALARVIVAKDWQIKIDEEFIRDPRSNLFRHTRETWHSHSSYPNTDDYSFYLSYHAMLAVAAKLLNEMPVVQQREWQEDEWIDWLHRHTLTRTDGRWLADRRDPAPLERRSWIGIEKSDNWRWEITPNDFLEGLFKKRNGETWLHFAGYWSDHDREYEEKYRISTALVSPQTSQSLLNALMYSDDPWNCYLPIPEGNRHELKGTSFDLKRLVCHDSPDKRLDDFDLYAGKIEYPPYQINRSILEQFPLKNDSELRTWCLSDTDTPSIVCEIWGESHDSDRREPIRYGKRMGASLDFLKLLCEKTDKEIIFLVQVERTIPRSYRNQSETDYQPPYYKIFILSEDGTLRDENRNY